jgi:hypothetical protein
MSTKFILFSINVSLIKRSWKIVTFSVPMVFARCGRYRSATDNRGLYPGAYSRGIRGNIRQAGAAGGGEISPEERRGGDKGAGKRVIYKKRGA